MAKKTVSKTNLVGDNEQGQAGKKGLQFVAALIVSLSTLSCGMTMAWTSQITQELLDGELGFQLTEDELGWVGSFSALGAAFFALFVGTICDLIGRKLTKLLLVIPLTIGWALILWPNNIAMLYTGRILAGMIGGAYCVTATIYYNEISEINIRGMLGSLTQLTFSLGIFLDSIFGGFLSLFWFTATCAAVPIIFAVAFVFMPETPVYYVKTNKLDQARKSLIKFRGRHYNIEGEIQDILNRVQKEKQQSGFKTIKQSFKQVNTQKACVIGMGMMILNTTCGMDPVTNYSSFIFNDLGMDPKTPAIILSSIQVFFAILQALLIEKLGRKVLLVVSSIVMSVCLVIVATALTLKNHNIVTEQYVSYLNYTTLIGIALFIVSFSMGLGPVSWIMVTEIYPEEVKNFLVSIGTSVTWLTSFAVVKVFLLVDTSWGNDVAFYILAAIVAFTAAFSYILVPETSGKSFEEIQIKLGAKNL